MSGLPSLATLSALAARLGVDPAAMPGGDVARAEAVLADASDLVRGEARRTWEDTAAPAPVVAVVLQVARRAFLNPAGVVSEAVGGISIRRSERDEFGVYLTKAELAVVHRFRSTSRPLWTQATTRDGDEAPVFLADQFGGDLFLVDERD